MVLLFVLIIRNIVFLCFHSVQQPLVLLAWRQADTLTRIWSFGNFNDLNSIPKRAQIFRCIQPIAIFLRTHLIQMIRLHIMVVKPFLRRDQQHCAMLLLLSSSCNPILLLLFEFFTSSFAISIHSPVCCAVDIAGVHGYVTHSNASSHILLYIFFSFPLYLFCSLYTKVIYRFGTTSHTKRHRPSNQNQKLRTTNVHTTIVYVQPITQ